ncbi:Rod shape-determining protein MreB [Acaryochloris thomasi RCC1774]|uniref:Cell shape-determining protein MreB n=1 Tax=Acaryochloris thomasi RCC1774 TaxID=1764569 RepID=A0A2W1JK66_9CYAN|nr:rod shape-determining protein [Acaryochloris thomasi]PZD73810.1 Rod shape-determining protein MreB [Acaryochloris thomasi RCC1774]
MGLFNRFSSDIGIDLGTANTLVYLSNRGIVLREPSVLTRDPNTQELLGVGSQAEAMIGRTPAEIEVVHPLQDGVITQPKVAQLLLEHVVREALNGRSLLPPRVVISMPMGASSVERRALFDIAGQIGAREAYLIEEPMAAAIGAGLPITTPVGNLVIDIGGGTTEIAVLSYLGVAVSRSIPIGGDLLDRTIMQRVKQDHSLLIGKLMARSIKHQLAAVYPNSVSDQQEMEIRGLDLRSGLPRWFNLRGGEVREYVSASIATIATSIKQVLEKTPPELAADILERGMILTGGGALLKGIDLYLSREVGLVAQVAPDPLDCVALGTGIVLEQFPEMKRVLLSS